MEESRAVLGDLGCLAWRDYVEAYRLLTAGHPNYAVAAHLPDAEGVVLAKDRDRT